MINAKNIILMIKNFGRSKVCLTKFNKFYRPVKCNETYIAIYTRLLVYIENTHKPENKAISFYFYLATEINRLITKKKNQKR